MTREEALDYAKSELDAAYKRAKKIGHKGKTRYIEVLEMAIQALSQEPCDDAVSREAVLEAVSESCQELRGVYGRCEELINALPPVTQKSGKWIELPKALNLNENPCKCSECGHILSFMNYYPKSNFCPNCGCRMVEPQESEE